MDFFREIFRFFIAKEYSFTSKFLGILIVIATLFFVDNILGFSFYYSNNQKINQLKNIETLKKDCTNNKYLLEILNETEEEILNRRNIVEIFFNLFSREQFDENNQISTIKTDTVFIIKYDTIIQIRDSSFLFWNFHIFDTVGDLRINKAHNLNNLKDLDSLKGDFDDSLKVEDLGLKQNDEVIMKKSRSRIWHTLTSSYLLIIVMLFLPFVPFTQKPFDWTMVIGMWIGSILIAGLVWLNQYLFGLIPVILNRPWINYLINFLISTSFWVWIGIRSEKKKKNAT